MNRSPWKLEEVDVALGGWRRSTVEMNSIPWSPVLRYATPLPMNGTLVSTVALQQKSISSVLRYATPLPINRTPFRPYEVRFLCFLRFAVRQTPPDEQDPVSTMA